MASETTSRTDTDTNNRLARLKAGIKALGLCVENDGGYRGINEKDIRKLARIAGIGADDDRDEAEVLVWQTGANLAIELLREAAALGENDTSLEDDYREGRPQRNLVLSYLRRLRALNEPRADEAFAAVLTDFVGIYASGVELGVYRDNTRRPIATTDETRG